MTAFYRLRRSVDGLSKEATQTLHEWEDSLHHKYFHLSNDICAEIRGINLLLCYSYKQSSMVLSPNRQILYI